MKIIILCSVVLLLSAGEVYAQSSEINDDIKVIEIETGYDAISLKSLFDEIEKQTSIFFSYDNQLIENLEAIKFSKGTNTVDEILKQLEKEKGLVFKQSEQTIGVSKRSDPEKWKLQGKVIDGESNDEIIGATVVIDGKNAGTITDIQGEFALEVSKGDKLKISFIGYKSQEIEIADQTNLKIALAMDVQQLGEVVVVGYGTQKKADLTSSVAVISTKDISETPYTGVDQIIQGKAAGVQVMSGGGLPGSGSAIKIRGINTWGNTEPLYVIDGVFFNATGSESFNPLSTINPNDIESISILKDASATAIYGSQAAGGVVLITTKKGKEGKNVISFSSTHSIAAPVKKLSVLNAREYFTVNKEIMQNAGRTLPLRFRTDSLFIRYDSTDWQDEIFQHGFQQEYNLSMNGGSKKNKYLFSLNYADKEGHIIDSKFQRIGLRVNTDFNLGRVKIGENLNASFVQNNLMPGLGLINNTLRIPPYIPVYSSQSVDGYGRPDGNIDLNGANNPVALAENNENWLRNFRIIGNIFAEVDILERLKYRTSLGFDIQNSHRFVFRYRTGIGLDDEFLAPNLRETQSYFYSPLWENTLSYSRNFKNITISALAGQSLKINRGRSTQIFADGFVNNEIANATLADVSSVVNNVFTSSSLLSYFGRLNINISDKYLIQANFRRDGSSRFSESNRWGNFPSASLGWRVNEEVFLRDIDFLSELKLRIGWGRSGNDRIEDFLFQNTVWKTSSVIYPLNDGENLALGATTGVNPASFNIRWETTEQTNVGLDLGLFEDQIQITAEYYQKNTFDVLTTLPVPPSLGFGFNGGTRDASPVVNAANVRNEGFDFTIQYYAALGSFDISLGGNAGFIRNEVMSLGDGEPIIPPFENIPEGVSRTAEGQAIGSFIGYVVDRVYSTSEEVNADNQQAQENGFEYYQAPSTSAGDIRFVDINSDGVVNSDDIVVLGSPLPNLNYGLNLNVSHKTWSLSLRGSGVSGNEIYNLTVPQNMASVRNFSTVVLDRWQAEGDQTDVPRAIFNDPSRNTRGSDRYVEDGSFFRLNTVTLSKNFKVKGFSQFNVFATVQNVFTITKYSGYDPEVAMSGVSPGNNLTLGVDNGSFPLPRIYSVGFNLTF